MKNNNNPVEGFIRDNAYKNIDKTHDLENEIMVSKRDISSEKIIPDKTFIRNNRIQMKCPFCGNLSVDFTKSKSSKEGAMILLIMTMEHIIIIVIIQIVEHFWEHFTETKIQVKNLKEKDK